MCLIVTGPSNIVRDTLLNTKGLLADIYKYNSDGFGAMYRNKRGLRIVKLVPKNLQQVIDLVSRLPQDDRNLALHARMTTHGDTNVDNCHPYPVADGVAMMHNGILACGNAKDKSRSDTYHFIQEFLADQVAQFPKIVHTPGFLSLVGDYIDNNRFVFMDGDGEMSIVNKDQGTEYGGMWFSNEYAWDAELLIPGYRKYGTQRYSRFAMDDDDDYYKGWAGQYGGATGTALTHYKSNTPSPYVWGKTIEDEFLDDVMVNCDVKKVAYVLKHTPYCATDVLFKKYDCTMSAMTSSRLGEMSDYEKQVVEHCLDEDLTWIRTACSQRPEKVADVLCYYLDWDEKVPATGRPDATVDVTNNADADAEAFEAAASEPTDQPDWYAGGATLPDGEVFWYLNHEVEVQEERDGTFGIFVYDSDGELLHCDTGFMSDKGAKSAALAHIDRIAEVVQ